MKIAIVFDNMIYGGIERVGIDYIKLLIELNNEIDVYILNPNVEDIINEIPKGVNIKIKSFSKFISPEAYWPITKKWLWGKFLFPIVHLGLTILTPVIRIFKGERKKYDIAIAFSGHINDLTYVTKYIKANNRIAWLHGALYGYLLISPGFVFLYNKIHNLVVLSNYLNEESLICNKFINVNMTRIYNPISVKKRPLNEEKIKELKKTYGDFLLMIGRFNKQKDQITVINALKILREKYNKEFKLLFVGDGENKIEVEKYAENVGMSKYTIFVGSKSDVQNYYSASKIFVHSSPAEGMPTVLLEAMSYSIPIVATDSLPGVREILGESKYGLICPVKDPYSMANCIYRLSTDSNLYNHYKVIGKERIKYFEPIIIKKQLENLLNSIGGKND